MSSISCRSELYLEVLDNVNEMEVINALHGLKAYVQFWSGTLDWAAYTPRTTSSDLFRCSSIYDDNSRHPVDSAGERTAAQLQSNTLLIQKATVKQRCREKTTCDAIIYFIRRSPLTSAALHGVFTDLSDVCDAFNYSDVNSELAKQRTAAHAYYRKAAMKC